MLISAPPVITPTLYDPALGEAMTFLSPWTDPCRSVAFRIQKKPVRKTAYTVGDSKVNRKYTMLVSGAT